MCIKCDIIIITLIHCLTMFYSKLLHGQRVKVDQEVGSDMSTD